MHTYIVGLLGIWTPDCMLSRPPADFLNETRELTRVCPNCALTLKITPSRDGTTIDYDMGAWASGCPCAEREDGPLSCPWVRRYVGAWLTTSK